MLALTAIDLEKLQATLPDYRLELIDGAIIVMTPSGYESREVALEFGAQLRNWVKPRRLGRVTGSSAGFILPNGDIRVPDMSFVLAHRLPTSPRAFAPLVPDLMVVVKSPADSLIKLRNKIQVFLEAGTKIGIFINPEMRSLELYRYGEETIVLSDGDVMTIPDLLPDWEVIISELWAPQFDQDSPLSSRWPR